MPISLVRPFRGRPKSFYTSNTRPYGVCQNLVNIIASRQIDGPISAYLGKVYDALHDFNEFLPQPTLLPRNLNSGVLSCWPYMVCLWITLPSVIRPWLGSLRVSAKPSADSRLPPTLVDASALVS